MNTPPILRSLVILIATLACGRAALAQSTTTIDVRSTVTLPAGAPVLLKHIATIAGPDADRLSTIVILHADEAKSTDETRTLSRDALRATLDKAPANWSRTLLRCGGTVITFSPDTAAATELTTSPAAASPAPFAATPSPTRSTPPPSSIPAPTDPRALRNLILSAIAEAAGPDISTTAVTLRTESLTAPDQQFLATIIPPAWKCYIKIMGATPSGRTSVKVEAYDNDRVALTKTVTVEAVIHREVLVVGPGGLARDQAITATDLRFETRLLSVTESARIPNLTIEQLATGASAARRRIDAGKPILSSDVTAVKGAVVCKRGDDVQVSCLAGGIILKSKAKSLGTAREGELVQLQVEGSKKVISARMSGPGKAVIALDPSASSSAAN